jgi:hypothetical protein
MARYIAENTFYHTSPRYQFIGWDELGGEATEATLAGNLGVKMSPHLERHFARLGPGESVTTDAGGRIQRLF